MLSTECSPSVSQSYELLAHCCLCRNGSLVGHVRDCLCDSEKGAGLARQEAGSGIDSRHRFTRRFVRGCLDYSSPMVHADVSAQQVARDRPLGFDDDTRRRLSMVLWLGGGNFREAMEVCWPGAGR